MTNLRQNLVERRQLDGASKHALDVGRNRLIVVGVMISLAFTVILGRLADLTVFGGNYESVKLRLSGYKNNLVLRSDILDRNGIILATSLPTASLYADPSKILDAEEAATSLIKVLPQLRRKNLLEKLKSKLRFVWLARNLSPQLEFDVNRLGLPGVGFQRSEKRVYPHGRLAAHVLGLTNVDGEGVAGIEKYLDHYFNNVSGPVELSLDMRIQAVLQEELKKTVKEFKAVGAAGIIMNVESGEILAIASLPDYDPNFPNDMVGEAGFNRATKGVYEMGSTFKLFTVAAALDMKIINLSDGYDASKPIRISRFSINDYHAKKRWLSVPEIILFSSNIGAAKMGRDIGTKRQKDYLARFGLLTAPQLELPEIGLPLIPKFWRPINTMTISYGHGIAVSPIQLISGISSIVNGGVKRPVTLIKINGKAPVGQSILSKKTSEQVRRLMRLVVSKGTGRKAATPGYLLGGKTGTADKLQGKRYSKSAKISSFVGVFPIDSPQYAILVMIDEPIGNKKTFNYATGGWVAAPAVGRIVTRIGPIAGIAPNTLARFATPKVSQNSAKKVRMRRHQASIKRVAWKKSNN